MLKHIALVILAGYCGCFVTNATGISPVITLQDGTQVNNEFIFTKNDRPTISSTNGLSGSWKIYKLLKDDTSQEVASSEYTNSITINPYDIDWWYSKQIPADYPLGDSFPILVTFCNEEGIESQIQLTFNLLPRIPEFTKVYFSEPYDWVNDMIGGVVMEIEVGDAIYYELGKTDSYWFSIDEMRDPTFLGAWFPYDLIKNPEYRYKIEDDLMIDWGTRIKINSKNEFGWSFGDYFFSTDAITDPKVLARIDYLREHGFSGSGTIATSISELCYKESKIYLPDNIEILAIYNTAGQALTFEATENVVNMAAFPKGLYYCQIISSSGQKQTLKIFHK